MTYWMVILIEQQHIDDSTSNIYSVMVVSTEIESIVLCRFKTDIFFGGLGFEPPWRTLNILFNGALDFDGEFESLGLQP